MIYLAAQCWRRTFSLYLCPLQVCHISVACRQVPEFHWHFICPCWEPGLLGLRWSMWLQILDLPSQSMQGSLKYLLFCGRSCRNPNKKFSISETRPDLHLMFCLLAPNLCCRKLWRVCLPPWLYVVISVGFQAGGWAVLLPPHSAAHVAEGAWIGPDVQHFADQLLRSPLLPGHCLTFW